MGIKLCRVISYIYNYEYIYDTNHIEKPEIVADEKPEIVADEKPEIVAVAKPEIVAVAKPEIVADAKPEIVAEKELLLFHLEIYEDYSTNIRLLNADLRKSAFTSLLILIKLPKEDRHDVNLHIIKKKMANINNERKTYNNSVIFIKSNFDKYIQAGLSTKIIL